MATTTSSARALTPPGTGAVAVVEVQLDESADPAAAFAAFSADPPRQLTQVPLGRIVYGRWNQEDVIIVRTANNRWEIQCHGGVAATQQILTDLRSAELVEPESSRYERSTTEELQWVVEQTVIRCRTRKTAALALAQADGRLRRLQEHLQCADEQIRRQASDVVQKWRSVADHLTTPWVVALAGRPNVGKSSLLNAIAGLQRAIVSSIPGTTRDRVETEVFLDGWPFLFVDTAGIRSSPDSELEAIGIQRTLETIDACDVVCLIADATTPTSVDSDLLIRLSNSSVPTLILWNKCDLVTLDPSRESPKNTWGSEFEQFRVSALTGTGLAEFLQRLLEVVLPEKPDLKTTLPLVSMQNADTGMPGPRSE
jgi:small GTP-binding protein